MKRLVSVFAFVAALSVAASSAFAAVTFQITSLDKEYTIEVTCGGSKMTKKLPANTTTSITIQGSAPCKIQYGGEIKSGDLTELKGGEKFTIKKGELKKQ